MKEKKSKRIDINELTPLKACVLRGKVVYSHITRKTSDYELQQINQRRKTPINKHHTMMTITDVKLVRQDSNEMSLEEKYATEQLFKSEYTNDKANFIGINTSDRLPKVAVEDENGTFVNITPKGELANGLDVSLLMIVAKNNGEKELQLESVIVNEPIKYYGIHSLSEKSIEALNQFTKTKNAEKGN